MLSSRPVATAPPACSSAHGARRRTCWVATAAALGVVLGATGIAIGPAAPFSARAGAASSSTASSSTCDLSALSKHKGTVDIDFWESMVTANAKTLTKLTTAFNASQSKVHVTLVQQKSYTTTWTKYQAGLSNGELPDLVQLTAIDLQGAVDSRSILPVQSCIDAAHYKTSGFIPRVLAAYKLDGTEEAMPFAASGPVLIYNQLAFEADGIATPPATLTQLLADAAVLKAHGSGMGLQLAPSYLETWLASADNLFVNHTNGRKGRATKVVFDSADNRAIWSDLDKLVSSGDAVTNPATGPDEYDNLLGIGSGQYAMTIDTTAVLGTVEAVLASGSYPNVKLGVAPFPVFSSKVHGGIQVGGSALYISDRKSALDEAASWDYIAYLDSTASQATWSAGTGYVPIRTASAASATVRSLWSSDPGYEVAYKQLLSGKSDAATAGAVIGPYTQVRTDELDAIESVLQGGVSPSAALASAQKQMDAALSSYNQRIGSS